MSIFANDFNNLTEEEKKLLREYFDGYDYRGAGYTFVSNYIWRTSYCVSWEIIEGYLVMAGANCGDSDAQPFMAMPLVRGKVDPEGRYRETYEKESFRNAIIECKERFNIEGKEFVFSSIPGHLKDFVEEALQGLGEGANGQVEFIHEEDYDEYVYLKEKLINLSGRSLHKKKNHLNFFLRNYEYEARPIREVDRADILNLSAGIRDYKAQDEDEAQDIESEYEAIEQILGLMDNGPENQVDSETCVECPICGVGIYINEKLEAFAIGEVITDTYAAEHFEKANDSYRGLYQLVCSEFCKQLPEGITYVNREEDMGLPGLRQAKEALKPHHMEERYTAEIRL